MFLPRLLFFDRLHPTDPLVARERRDVFPLSERRFVGFESFSYIRGYCMRDAGGNYFCGHEVIVTKDFKQKILFDRFF